MTIKLRLLLVSVAWFASAGMPLAAVQQQPPDKPPLLSTVPSPPAGVTPVPADMSGQPLQVGDLPPGVVVIRVIRRSFAENIPAQRVHLQVGQDDRQVEATTDESGRARFDGLRIGETVRVVASVEGETLGSGPFEIPADGGVRMLLVAGVGAGVPVSADSVATTDNRPRADARQPDPASPIVSLNAASVAIALFAMAGAAILWSLRPRHGAANRRSARIASDSR